jgi:outer membrane lipoprotein-sorting protein
MKKYVALFLVFSVIFAFGAGGDPGDFFKNFYDQDNLFIKGKIVSTESDGNKVVMGVTLWQKGELRKSEMKMISTTKKEENPMAELMMNFISINDNKNKKSYIIYPGKKAYIESDTSKENNRNLQNANKTQLKKEDYVQEKKLIGSEKTGKYNCNKYRLISYLKSSPKTTRTETILWETKKDKFPIKMETTDASGEKTTFIVEEYSMKTIPDSVFTPPKDYKKVNSMMELMMGDMKMQFEKK